MLGGQTRKSVFAENIDKDRHLSLVDHRNQRTFAGCGRPGQPVQQVRGKPVTEKAYTGAVNGSQDGFFVQCWATVAGPVWSPVGAS